MKAAKVCARAQGKDHRAHIKRTVPIQVEQYAQTAVAFGNRLRWFLPFSENSHTARLAKDYDKTAGQMQQTHGKRLAFACRIADRTVDLRAE